MLITTQILRLIHSRIHCLLFRKSWSINRLPFLKHVNDTFGHKWGDVYIAQTAQHLRVFSEQGDIVGRISGDEFSVFMYGYRTREELLQVVDSFYAALDKNPIQFPNELRTIKISGGIYWLNEAQPVSYEDMMQKADSALYTAKRTKKGSWFVFNQTAV